MTTHYLSDSHFEHPRCATEFRGFSGSEEHDELLVENWNRVVRKDDRVFHLGDVTGGSLRGLSYIPKLNGRKILIAGNHDVVNPMHREWFKYLPKYLEAGFEAVMPFARRKVAGMQFLMSHFPYTGDHTDEERHTQYRLPDKGLPLVHGHVHDLFTERGRGLNVGVDRWNFTPVHEDAVVEWLKRMQ